MNPVICEGQDITKLVKHAIDFVEASMDWGSGFLYDEDVIVIRRIARIMGLDPEKYSPTYWNQNTSGAVKVESEHHIQQLYNSGKTVSSYQSICLCGWTGSRFEFPHHREEEGEEWRNSWLLSQGQAADDGSKHIQDMLDQARNKDIQDLLGIDY